MKTIKAQFTTTPERLEFFARARGWNEVEDIDTFIAGEAKKLLAEVISGPAKQEAEDQLRTQRNQVLQGIDSDIAQAINVEVNEAIN